MNFLVDVHLPISLSKFLGAQANCKSIHVNQILQKWHTTDSDICRYADDNLFVVVTKDQDFKNSFFINKTPKKVIRISMGNLSNKDLISQFEKYLPFILPLDSQTHFYVELSIDQITVIN